MNRIRNKYFRNNGLNDLNSFFDELNNDENSLNGDIYLNLNSNLN